MLVLLASLLPAAFLSATPSPRKKQLPDRDWWSLKPLNRPRVPRLSPAEARLALTPIDAFIIARHREHGLSLSPSADRRALIRRLYFDLIGLPPSPQAVESFVADGRPDAYERLVDSLLSSVRHGERWSRHWLDVVHYADTHGYDKDKLRPNAWPYRDYVIRSFNDDKPYSRFVEEQLAGDVIYPGTVDGMVGTGFIAAGPWDFIGHAEVPESKIDGKIARHLDRDDMVTATMTTFVSTTVGCAQCHDHKFDPVSMEDYYSLHAVFAALDRADRRYDESPDVAKRRAALETEKSQLSSRKKELDERVRKLGGELLVTIEKRIQAARGAVKNKNAAFGYHSQIEAKQDVTKWVQVDLGGSRAIEELVLVASHDDFNSIGAGFGFPVRFRVELSDDPQFQENVVSVADHTATDVPNPGCEPQRLAVGGGSARFVRVTATKLALRQNDYIFALGELIAIGPGGDNLAFGAAVTSLDSIEAPVRWARKNLVDGYYFGIADGAASLPELGQLEKEKRTLLERVVDAELKNEIDRISSAFGRVDGELKRLPQQRMVYAGTIHRGSGAFRGTAHDGGKPREIRVLQRGQVTSPGELVGAGTIDIIDGVQPRFALPDGHAEGERRRALAQWIVDRRNPLTWRSIVNRIWQYHFGRGLVDSPNDFGHMGELPSHPDLLDWLAVEFRDGGQSIKTLHRRILTSAVYRQSSASDEASERIDGDNRYLWRMNRRRLEVEALRDSVLAISGKLEHHMYGPAFQCFVLERPEHSPHYQYHKHDPDDPKTHRRSIYRFIVRSQPDPFLRTLDCADSSQTVAKRNETLTALQALAQLNNRFMVVMSEHFAERLERLGGDTRAQIETALRLALGRSPQTAELEALSAYAEEFGLVNTCRVLFNLNEFVYVD